MNRIKYAEQLYALISMCLGCAFIVFGLLSFIGILQPTSASFDGYYIGNSLCIISTGQLY